MSEINYVCKSKVNFTFNFRKRNYFLDRCYMTSYFFFFQTNIPYRRIMTSIPVYALLNEFFISSFTLSLTLLLPLYVKGEEGFEQ